MFGAQKKMTKDKNFVIAWVYDKLKIICYNSHNILFNILIEITNWLLTVIDREKKVLFNSSIKFDI